MWPFFCGQIHTSVHAGGIAIAARRARSSGSVMTVPSGFS
jgi:hypothetical protein